ncbi:MAG: hypothetical protein JKX91_11205 [Rhizobiaceae bacterium]|nr:hypothetical protein [Rhizobiaceae bacterium]
MKFHSSVNFTKINGCHYAIADEYLVASQTKSVKAHIITRAISVGDSGFLGNMFFAALSAMLAMGLYITVIIPIGPDVGAGLKPYGKISRELVPDAVQNLPEFAV